MENEVEDNEEGEEDEPLLEGEDEEGFGKEEEQDEALPMQSIAKKGKQKKAKFPKFDPNNLESILADAEQFSHLIEENDDDAGLTSSVSNSDKAGKKQLAWERKREGAGAGGGYKGKKGGGPGKGGQKKGGSAKGGQSKPMSSKSKPMAKK